MMPTPFIPNERFPDIVYHIHDDDDDALSDVLEKIYLYSRSLSSPKRLFIVTHLAHHLHLLHLHHHTSYVSDALSYVLPLLPTLALDHDDSVKEALANEIPTILWWFYTNCQLGDSDLTTESTISVQAFTPILCALLLSPNPSVSSAARQAVVDILARIRAADEPGVAETGLFTGPCRRLFENEVIYGIIIGMGRLDEDSPSPPFPEMGATKTISPVPCPPLTLPDADPPSYSLPVPEPPSGSVLALERGEGGPSAEAVEAEEQAAVGRLSSMSLVAAVTANAGDALVVGTQLAFVHEVQRAGRDDIWWIRKEACFALGALAKVVPVAVVLSTLLPLLEALIRDSCWPVRHSAVFALPALLARLPRNARHTLALQSVLALTADPIHQVRSGVLEALGEVICAFPSEGDENGETGPPKELLEAFLGKGPDEAELDPFYTDPSRPLVCAFNFPAVVFTLGRDRWGEVRLAYLKLAGSEEVRVRRSIAAGIGAIAHILGRAWAERDLVGVWAGSVGFEEEGVRSRAVGCLGALMEELGEGKRGEVVRRLRGVWEEGVLDGWKEREDIAVALTDLARFGKGREWEKDVRWLVRRALEDPVAAVRQAVVDNLPELWMLFTALHQLEADIYSLASSESARRRMVYVACQQELILRGPLHVISDDVTWAPLVALAEDRVTDVRIGVARLVGLARQRLASYSKDDLQPKPMPSALKALAERLSQDIAGEVRAFVPVQAVLGGEGWTWNWTVPGSRRKETSWVVFSRPPPSPAASAASSTERHSSPRATDPHRTTGADDSSFSPSPDIQPSLSSSPSSSLEVLADMSSAGGGGGGSSTGSSVEIVVAS